LEVVAFGELDLALAATAWERYGKGRHPAKLNFGDCFAYALAQRLDSPLLFVGDDFRKTDVRIAMV
jgi:ribonuclease VapC